ncbi:MAG: glycosyltransferase family 9 protein [Chthoniobacteraceae bacterium]
MTPRILVIRGGAIGDFVLTLPAIKLLRDNFPDAHLEILGYKHIIALAEGRFYAHATRSIEYGAMAGFFIPDAKLAPDLIEYFGSFHQIVSYLFDPDGIFEDNMRRCGVKNFVHVSPKLDDSSHAASQLAQPLQDLALFLENPAATIYPSAADREFAASFFGGLKSRIIAIHPGSGSDTKNWPVKNWLALGGWLFSLKPAPAILLIGGEADRASHAALSAAWKNYHVYFAEDVPLPHLAALLERCDLFVGHDSGISHIAAATGIPCLLMFGPTDPEVWAPANPRVKWLAAPASAMANLPVDEVRTQITQLLSITT